MYWRTLLMSLLYRYSIYPFHFTIDGDGSIGWYFCRRSRANVSGGLKIISLQMFQLLKCFHLRLKSHRYR